MLDLLAFSGSFSAFDHGKPFTIADGLPPVEVEAQPTTKDSPTTRITPRMFRIKTCIFEKFYPLPMT